MDKVKITQKQADEITYHLQLHTNLEILHIFNGTGESNWDDGDSLTHHIINMDEETLIKALYIGYEVEETPEDKVRELYEYLGQESIHYASKDIQNKIQIMLNLLNIKIAGVNHD